MPPLRPTRQARLPMALRAALLLGLLALVVVGFRPDHEPPTVTRLAGSAADDDRLGALLVDRTASAAVLREAGEDPSEHEIQALAAAAARAPLFVELPEERPRIRAAPPDDALTDRYAAVRFVATAAPGDTVAARLLGPDGAVLDSARVVADATGSVAGAFRVRPGRAGWTEWRVGVAGAGPPGNRVVARAGAWVTEAEPPRVLVVAGPPSWESRYAVRALERSGADVALVQNVGRDNVITGGGADPAWSAADALAAYDVVILLPGAQPDAAALAALDTWTATGKGVLAASAAAASLGLGGPAPGAADSGAADSDAAASGGREPRVRADSLVWTAPAEIAPLPAADLAARVIAGVAPPPGATVAARDPAGDPVLILAPYGRGRVAGLGLRDSWRWVLDAGLEAEHRAFWRSLVDWLAAPSADSLAVTVTPLEAPLGTVVDVGVRRGGLDLQRPTGELDPLPSGRDDGGLLGRFVAVDTGVHEVRTGDATVAAFRARPRGEPLPAELGRARLSLLAVASGGGALEPEAFAARARDLAAPDGGAGGWLPWIFAALAILALAEWALRRRRGLP